MSDGNIGAARTKLDRAFRTHLVLLAAFEGPHHA